MPHALSPSTENAPSSQPDNEMADEISQAEEQAVTEAPETNLQDMFDDDDDDDEFTSSAPTNLNSQPQASLPSSKQAFSEPDVLRQYYARLLPFRPLFQWLNHSPTPQPDFQNREFAFQLPGGAYVRYQSFASADLFRKQCVQMTPERFEIGPQYSINPRDRKSLRKASAFRPVMKELVFDIDMTDYDNIRTCCSGAAICPKCWRFIVMAIQVVDAALRQDFGFTQILWVYSGRRGAHAWVSDKRAREMDDAKRKAVANYLVLAMSGDQGKKASIRRPLHPHLDRSLKILNPYFQTEVLTDQDPWETPEQAEKLLSSLPDKSLQSALQKKWDSMGSRSSTQKWADIDTAAEAGNLHSMTAKQLVEAKQDIRLEYTYPRLDAEVSKKLNHLLKSPFVVHPGTGRVCVPIDTRNLDAFDPFAVPKVTDLLNEIDEWDEKNKDMDEAEKAKVQDWQKTSLKSYVEYFRGYVTGLLKEETKGKREREEATAGADSMEF
ncbi:dna primase small subunit [Acrodontium crateriforme]|uniref:DNA primase n=1 Tax=Acrodontium crateriforme TaxID=150365 RepID=A0AAQ3M9S8_9PEZI|nr:dna primase small subunit [Acrodontium crateriforme]